RFRRVLHKTGDDVVGIIGITNRVRPTEQHLKTDVRNLFAKLAQTFPRIFVEKTHRAVEGRAAPHFQTEKFRRATRNRASDGEHVVSANARGEKRLMRVTKS